MDEPSHNADNKHVVQYVVVALLIFIVVLLGALLFYFHQKDLASKKCEKARVELQRKLALPDTALSNDPDYVAYQNWKRQNPNNSSEMNYEKFIAQPSECE
jgi:uncharacterized protein YpmB